MNPRRACSILGLVLVVLAAAELVPIAFCLVPLDLDSMAAFVIGAGASLGTGLLLRLFGSKEGELYRRDGVVIVVGSWLLASIVGAIPYVASGSVPGLADALFESSSGFTTTGASILVDIEAVPRPILFWRSMTQWLGGIGIVVLFVALLSELGPGARFSSSSRCPVRRPRSCTPGCIRPPLRSSASTPS
ncbi:MAG: potassium transporter TrkG [Myxococcota bacterium]